MMGRKLLAVSYKLWARKCAPGACHFHIAVAALIACSVLTPRARATQCELTLQQKVQVLNEGLQAFDKGSSLRQANPTEAARDFREAADKFQLLADSGLKNGKLLYDLGNAWLESGQVGKAILNYRRAQQLTPDDGRLTANLRYARTLRRNQLPESGERAFLQTLFFWHHSTSTRGRFMLGVALYVVFWLLLIARNFMPRFRWRYVLVPCALGWLALAASVAVSLVGQSTRQSGVVLANDVTVRKGNGEGFEPQFKEHLYEGVEFDVLEKRTDWLHIELPDGKDGWIAARDAELI